MSAQEGGRTWWASLSHGGLLIAPARLAEFLPETADAMPANVEEQLRRALVRGASDAKRLGELLDLVLEQVLGLHAVYWSKGPDVDPAWVRVSVTGESVKPRRIWKHAGGAILPVFVADAEQATRLGVGRGRRAVARVVEWLRRANQPVALVTNGRQWRIVHAGPDYDAWCEADSALWFEEGKAGAQVTALRLLLGPNAIVPPQAGKPAALIAAIQASRQGQSELSSVLGERVRQAVELLIRECAPSLEGLKDGATGKYPTREIYLAATRMIMRCVVILFSESRDLLPRSHVLYDESYGLQSLRHQLSRQSGGRRERLRHARQAWPRLLALFRLVHDGSGHEVLPIPRYGGALFEAGDAASGDPVLRAVAALERPDAGPTDMAVADILDLLCVSKVKVRQGRGSRWVNAPVDFSDLSSEYLGILYEGLLDFELHRVPDGQPVIFLNLGEQPALPMERLREMSDAELAKLLEKLKQAKKEPKEEADDGEDASDDAEEDEAEEGELADEPVEEPAAAASETDSDVARTYRELAHDWAVRAVKAAKLVRYPRNDRDARVRDEYARQVDQRADELIARLLLPGEWYLVRWGGTRKGAGTFYTRPQLAWPIVQRTLQTLAYEVGEEGELRAKTPEQILALKVCDPAMGSASFLVSALRYLTEALRQSLHVHGRLAERADGTIIRLADGLPAEHPSHETLPVRPDHADFEELLRARLKRHVVERCIYGVDLDALAVELARTALWIETMDRSLQFGFLDHKLKCGNSLVGCWFDQFTEYPVQAWERDGGDSDHGHGVHFGKGEWTRRIKELRNGVVRPSLPAWYAGQERLRATDVEQAAEIVHLEASALLQQMHALPPHATDERAAIYRERIEASEPIRALRAAFDSWCAVWFWPGDAMDCAVTPENFMRPDAQLSALVSCLRLEHGFFHWELEFADVFSRHESGFDAILGNPSWETQKPSSLEFFSNIDPLFRTYGKQEAVQAQRAIFETSPAVERSWLLYCARFAALSNYFAHSKDPWGDPASDDTPNCNPHQGKGSRAANEAFHAAWRQRRGRHPSYAHLPHPFRFQGAGDISTYKLFLEQSHALLRTGGRLGVLVPASLHSDLGATLLRQLFLTECQWSWLFGFENRERIFAIDSRFKFDAVIVERGGATDEIRTGFMRRSLRDWEDAESHTLLYPRAQIERFSPHARVIVEIRASEDLEVLDVMYRNGVLLDDEHTAGWRLKYAREFDMTNDSKLFPPRSDWEAKGYQADEYGFWHRDGDDVAVPLYEGRMIGSLDFSEKSWVRGKGRGAEWRRIPWSQKILEPQYLMANAVLQASTKAIRGPKLAFMSIGSATNARTVICTYLNTLPANHSVGILRSLAESKSDCLLLAGVLNAFSFDYQVRCRLGGLNLSEFVMAETALPQRPIPSIAGRISNVVARLALAHKVFAPDWIELGALHQRPWLQLWAVTPYERLRLRAMLDAVIAELYRLSADDIGWILRDCDLPLAQVRHVPFSRSLNPKGFWRVDKDRDPELRHPVLALIAFHDLKRMGLEAFLAQNDGDGWMLPDTLRLADYGLGHDDRAKEAQPVASRLGDRFLPWQLAQGVDESWELCAQHAERVSRILGAGSDAAIPAADGEQSASSAEAPPGSSTPAVQAELFGMPIKPPTLQRRPRR